MLKSNLRFLRTTSRKKSVLSLSVLQDSGMLQNGLEETYTVNADFGRVRANEQAKSAGHPSFCGQA